MSTQKIVIKIKINSNKQFIDEFIFHS